MTTQEWINKLFARSSDGAVRSKVFSTFYEDLWRRYFPYHGFEPAVGKPRIYWRDVTPPASLPTPNWARLSGALDLKRSNASHCYPDGLLHRGGQNYVWEAKNWIPGLFSETTRFENLVWNFPWLLAQQIDYRGKPLQIHGFCVSWWRNEPGTAETVQEINEALTPRTLEVFFTADMLADCIEHQYPWYLDLVKEKRLRINKFFDALASCEGNPLLDGLTPNKAIETDAKKPRGSSPSRYGHEGRRAKGII